MNPLVERLGWMFVHSVWQGTLAWLALKVLLIVLRKRSAHARYLASCLALAVATLVPWATFIGLDLYARVQVSAARPAVLVERGNPVVSERGPAPDAAGFESPVRPSSAPMQSLGALLDRHVVPKIYFAFPWIVIAWALGSAWSAARLLVGWKTASRLARGPLEPLPDAIAVLFERTKQKLGIRRMVRIGVSALTEVPAVIGALKPVILLPAGFISGLSPLQIEAILAHELAHVARHDFLVNLLQAVAESIFFYHPAVWSINRHIRLEREQACDDIALAATGDPILYAKALSELEALRAPALAVGASGDGDLLARIRYILGLSRGASPWKGFAWGTLAGVLLYLIALFTFPLIGAWMMTTRERIAAIQAQQPITPIEIEAAFGKDAKMRLDVSFRRADGKPFEGRITFRRQIRTTSGSHSVLAGAENGIYSQDVDPGEVSIMACVDGYAPIYVGPLIPDLKTKTLAPISIPLVRGPELRIKFVDAAGHPVSGVKLSAMLSPKENPTFSDPVIEINAPISDMRGELTLPTGAPKLFAKLAASKLGLSDSKKTLRLNGEVRNLVWTLAKGPTLQRRILDSTTHEPVPGASVLVMKNELGQPHAQPLRSQSFTTDGEGRFTLASIEPGTSYRIVVSADSYAPYQEIVSETSAAEILISHGYTISGVVKGLPDDDKAYPMTARSSLLREGNRGYSGHTDIILEPSPSPRPFRLYHIPVGSLDLEIAGKVFPHSVTADTSDLVLTVAEPRPPDTPPLPAQRVVELRFQVQPGEPLPSGTVTIDRIQTRFGRMRIFELLDRKPISEPKLSFEVDAPTRLRLSASRLIGYWFADIETDVPASREPLMIDVPLRPAGAIAASLVDSTGKPAAGSRFYCVATAGPAATENQRKTIVSQYMDPAADPGKFLAVPLPFDGRYIIVAASHDGTRITVSPEIRVDRLHPLPTVEFVESEGIDIQGQVLTPEGRPAPRKIFTLAFRSDANWAIPGGEITTDDDGRFVLRHVNLDLPGHYEIRALPPTQHAVKHPTLVFTRDTPFPLVVQLPAAIVQPTPEPPVPPSP